MKKNSLKTTLRAVLKAMPGLRQAYHHASQAKDIVRLLRYDARSLLRSSIDQSEQADDSGLFFPVCFACAKHFEILRIALRSLSIWARSVKEINIYMDKTDPFTAAQCDLLRSESRYPLKFHQTVYPTSQPGLRLILSELYAFRKLAKQMRPGDFLLKFDSDVIFLSDAIFQFVASRKAGAIGTRVSEIHPTIKDDYMQGGSYFIAGGALRAMLKSRITATGLALSRKYSPLFEDQFISPLLRQSGTTIVGNNFLYHDSMLAKPGLAETELEARLQSIPATASILHFEGDKSNMRRAAEKLRSAWSSSRHLNFASRPRSTPVIQVATKGAPSIQTKTDHNV